MPVRFAPSGERHNREEYSFYTRDHGSRDFARSRRFGDDDGDEGRTMSLVSSPLQVPLIGKRRSMSPSQNRSPAPHRQIRFEDDFDEEDFQEDDRMVQQQRRRPVERRRRYEYKDYDTYDDVPLEPLVPTYQPRVGRSGYRSVESRYESASPRRQPRYQRPQYEEDFGHDEEIHQHKHHEQKEQQEYPEEQVEKSLPSQKQRQDEELQSILNWRKRRQTPREPLVHTDFGYVMPPMRKRTDPALQDQEDKLRSALGYVAKRKEFAVEDDEDMQYYRNPNYYYRMHGPERPLVTDKEVEENMERTKLDKAPMFDMKIRSHVVWEKMNVKFTCTVRGSPKPRVTWYKDMVPIEPSLHSAGKYKISNQFGLHTLEINRASIEDSGTYRVSLQNRKGEISSYATLLVRRYDGGRMGVVDFKSGYNLKKPTDYPDVEGMHIPGSKPLAGEIKVREYDELPETDASRHFKSQLENLDFDVKKLMKEAKLDKDIAKSDDRLHTSASGATTIDDATFSVRQPGDVTLDGTTKISELSKTVNGQKRDSTTGYISGDDTIRIYTSDFSSDGEGGKSKNRFKVAVEINVTNENRRDSFDTFEKVLGLEKKNGSDEKEPEPGEKDEADQEQLPEQGEKSE